MLLFNGQELNFGKFPNGETNLNFNHYTFTSNGMIGLKLY